MTSQIKAKIIADSVSDINGQRITTFELEYPRFIHSELMTHRLFSRNAMSSRAVPIEKMIEQVRNNPAKPIHWGKNQSGMQASEELGEPWRSEVEAEWGEAAKNSAKNAEAMMEMYSHKQVVNRIIEPFQLMKTVLTATEFDNFFWLRKHEDAQPEIKELADKMYGEMKLSLEQSRVNILEPEDWHVPYYQAGAWSEVCISNEIGEEISTDIYDVTLADALAISSSCCAQVSYRLLDDTIEKARKVYQRLVESTPVHASPFEHCASPMKYEKLNKNSLASGWEKGITHMDKEYKFWSGNFKSWIQYRQLIDGNVCNKYEEK